jgi:ribosomal protein S18 acetylase RimI-like enzyme
VAPAHQRRGTGRRLLAHAIEVAGEAARHAPISELRLTVADSNAPARALFAAFGFERIGGGHEGRYDHGQLAMRLRRLLNPPPASP